MLRQLKDIAKKCGMEILQLSVEKNNKPSINTIIKNGGEFNRSFIFQGEEADVYFIKL